jgi:hypothetical protein
MSNLEEDALQVLWQHRDITSEDALQLPDFFRVAASPRILQHLESAERFRAGLVVEFLFRAIVCRAVSHEMVFLLQGTSSCINDR